MNFDEYQVAAMRTRPKEIWPRQFLQAGIGMAEEAGEVLGLVKKQAFHGHELTEQKEKLMEECGDTLWHIALMADLLDVTLEEIAEKNIEKLKQRYPEGFSEEKSRNR